MHTADWVNCTSIRTRIHKAIESFQSAYELKPNVSQTRHNLVVAYSTYAKYLDTQNRHDEAINQLQQALAVTPTQVNLHVSLARVYQRAGNLDRAQAAFTSALRIIQITTP